MEPLVIKLSVSGRRQQPSFHKIEHTPYTIGRAFDNDLIIADETVSPHQIRILDVEGEYRIENCSEDNGSWMDDKEVDSVPEELIYPSTINIGRTHLEVLSVNTPVKATRVYGRMSAFTAACSSLPIALTLLSVFFGISLYTVYHRLSIVQEWNEILVSQISTFLVPVFIAAFMGFLSRMFLHRWNFPLQLSIVSLCFIVISLISLSTTSISYFFTSYSVARYLNQALLIFAAIVFLKWQLVAISSVTAKRALFTSLALVASVAVFSELQIVVNRVEFSPQPVMHTVMARYDRRLVSTDSLTDFVVKVQTELAVGIEAELAE